MVKKISPLFTICIPVYNVEEYISGAVQDIINQTCGDFECILIDDCSPDNAINVAREVIKDDARFLFKKNPNNLGASETRNRGLAWAKGEYILFLDSDDRFDVKLLEYVQDAINKAKLQNETLDVITWEFGGVDAHDEKIKQLEPWRNNEISIYKKPTSIYKPQDFADTFFQINSGHMCMKSFRIQHIRDRGLTFDSSMKFSEDALFSYTAMILAKNIYTIPDDNILYFYRRNQPNSVMHTVNYAAQIGDQLKAVEMILEHLKTLEKEVEYRRSFNMWVSNGVGAIAGRLIVEYQQKNTIINNEIMSIYDSYPWKIESCLRKFRDVLSRARDL